MAFWAETPIMPSLFTVESGCQVMVLSCVGFEFRFWPILCCFWWLLERWAPFGQVSGPVTSRVPCCPPVHLHRTTPAP
jgi:hypothetical protein